MVNTICAGYKTVLVKTLLAKEKTAIALKTRPISPEALLSGVTACLSKVGGSMSSQCGGLNVPSVQRTCCPPTRFEKTSCLPTLRRQAAPLSEDRLHHFQKTGCTHFEKTCCPIRCGGQPVFSMWGTAYFLRVGGACILNVRGEQPVLST